MIRPITPADTPLLLEITAGTGVFKAMEVEALREVLDDYHAFNHADGHRGVIYERDGVVAGFAYYAPAAMTDRTWYLYWIAVNKQVQARGIGAALLQYAEEEITREGGRVLFIETSSLPHYDLTRRFYLKQGYHLEATLHDYYAAGDHMVIFRKQFAG